MVAKSYQGLKELSEPFEKNGKMYITIETKSGLRKDVRFYTEKEYIKMYPDEKEFEVTCNHRIPLGFHKGYITIFKGVKEEHEDWFCESICRFATLWGWYVVSNDEVPKDLPFGVKPVRLDWDRVGDKSGTLYDNVTVQRAVLSITADKEILNLDSTHQGSIGERLELKVKVIDKDTEENRYGKTHFYTLKDNKNNLYLWKTAARDWDVGVSKEIRGTVKNFIERNGEAITVLTRCTECN